MTIDSVFSVLLDFSFYYPLFMSYTWVTGALYYFFYREHHEKLHFTEPPPLSETPGVTFIVPCHDEGENAAETIDSLLRQDYPDFEIIAVNDASNDDTAQILDRIARHDSRVRVVHFEKNQGKAMGLRIGAVAARNEFLICLDGDALLDAHATRWLMRHFVESPRVGAVTGNPRVRNRSTLLGKIQVGEFSSIIGLIKRAQRIYGRIFTISGVVSAYRRSAVHRVGYWGLDMVTEDIDISWRLQLNHWDIRYEPNALCWILMPETLRGLWRQRLRWAKGGIEVLIAHFSKLLHWRSRRMWLVVAELIVSTFWAYTMALIFTLWVVDMVYPLPAPFGSVTIPPGWTGVLLGLTCLIQFAVSLRIDSRYEKKLGRLYYFMVWYPLAYWAIQTAVAVAAVPLAIFQRKGKRATWVSPDRGLRPVSSE